MRAKAPDGSFPFPPALVVSPAKGGPALPRIDRYILSQFLQYFGFFALVIAGVYWVNKAVGLFDQLIGDKQSLWVFVRFSLLTLPGVIKMILPVASFIATVYGTNRLMGDSEMVVLQATGFSPLRLARPVIWFGLIVAAMTAVLTHVLVPQSRAALAEARAAISEDLTGRFLETGVFTHPGPGITLFIREITDKGALTDILLVDASVAGRTQTYTAPTAVFAKGENGPKLILLDGMSQVLDRAGRLSVTRFADFTYDLGAMLVGTASSRRSAAELTTTELLWPDKAILKLTRSPATELVYAGHQRLADAAMALATALIGFAALMGGGFSRFGLWRQIALAVGLLVVVQGVATVAAGTGGRFAGGWVLAWAAPLLGIGMATGLLALAGRRRRGGAR